MTDLKVLEKFGCTRERLREIFERQNIAEPGKGASEEERQAHRDRVEDEKVRKCLEGEIEETLHESMQFGLKNYQFYAAIDLAWDTPAVSKAMIPLLLYAQGKINLKSCADTLSSLNCASAFVKKDKQTGEPVSIDIPKMVDVSINMVRSYVTRRHSAQSVKYSNLYPYYKYESRSTGQIGKLRADVVSQEAEVVVDGFDYRHHDSQVMRDAFLYGHSVDFVRCGWEVMERYEFLEKAPEFSAGTDLRSMEVETVIAKEGVSWVQCHPTRLIASNAEPLASINSDTGIDEIGYWDVCRYGDVAENPAYFNRNCITYGPGMWEMYQAYTSYFTQYYEALTPPPSEVLQAGGIGSTLDPAGGNDRKANVGVYNGNMKKMAMFKAEFFKKLIPSDYRIGSYPFQVWIRFVVASDSTVIFAEPLPSSPAAYLGINESDSRQLNTSPAHDVMWAQDMMSNLVTQMMVAVQGEMLKVIGINTDLVSQADVDKIVNRLKGVNYSVEGPIVIPFSIKQIADELDLKLDALFKIGETKQGSSLDTIFKAMTQVLALMERLTAMSPAEQGQPAPREISATEVTEIASTTQGVYSFISDAIDEYRSAKKRILYESLVCCKKGKVQVPVLGRYTRKTIEAAGFTPVEGEDADLRSERPQRSTVTGSPKKLRHDLIFTTRDGAERPVNTQAANSMVQMLNVLVTVPGILQALGREKLYAILNEIFRMSGTGVDLNLEMQEGEDGGFGDDQIAQMQQMLQQLQQVLEQIASATQKNAQDVADQQAINEQQQGILDGVSGMADLLKKTAGDINALFAKVERLEKAEPPPEIPYRDAPEEARRILEKRAGMEGIPAHPTYLEVELSKQPATKTSVVGQV